jgi:putative cardiolipin synthase
MTDDKLVEAIEHAVRKLPASQIALLAQAIAAELGPTASGRNAALAAVPTPRYREIALALLDEWTSKASDLPGSAVALALRSASRTLEQEQHRESVDIVWTGPTTAEVPVRLTREALIDVIRAAQEKLIIVSFAAYKVEVIVNELTLAADRGVGVRLILETDEVGGGTLTVDAADAFSALRKVAEFYVWPADKRPALEHGKASLHAKAAVADDHTALVTSANLTGHALTENMELGLLVRGGPIPKRLAAHFQQLMNRRVLVRVEK